MRGLRPRYRLRMGFEDDFEVLEVVLIKEVIDDEKKVDHQDDEVIQWIETGDTVKRVRVKSRVLLSLATFFVVAISAGVGFFI